MTNEEIYQRAFDEVKLRVLSRGIIHINVPTRIVFK